MWSSSAKRRDTAGQQEICSGIWHCNPHTVGHWGYQGVLAIRIADQHSILSAISGEHCPIQRISNPLAARKIASRFKKTCADNIYDLILKNPINLNTKMPPRAYEGIQIDMTVQR